MIHTTDRKVALAHDWFTQYGGAERMMLGLHELYPESPVFTLAKDDRLVAERFAGWDIRPSHLQKLYLLFPRLQYLLVFIPVALRFLRIRNYDFVLSSSSSFMKSLYLPKGMLHINYCHTPTRFVWSEPGYTKQEAPGFFRPLARLYLQWFKRWDYRASQRVDYFIANSKEVQKRIKQYYNRDSQLIYPFVDFNFWKPTQEKKDYFLIAGRLHAHKDNELIIQVFNELGLPLHVVGTGRQEAYLKSIAKNNITFLGRVSDEVLRDEYNGARGFIYPQFEDFGLMPLEAASCGTATLGLAKGGSLETIIPGVTGELFDKAGKETVKKYIESWNENKYSLDALRSHAQKFSKEIFKQKIAAFIHKIVSDRL